MANTISALSLILGMYTAIYIKWFDEIKKALNIDEPRFREDGKQNYELVKKVNWFYVFPLTLFSLLLTIIILPEWYKHLMLSIGIAISYPFNIEYYDMVLAIFLLIGALSIIFTIYILICFLKLLRKTKLLNPKG